MPLVSSQGRSGAVGIAEAGCHGMESSFWWKHGWKIPIKMIT